MAMKVTNKMIMAMAKEMADYGWLEENWLEVRKSGTCKCCGKYQSGNSQDDIDETKGYLYGFLEAALKAAK
jgi:hypothetical protein